MYVSISRSSTSDVCVFKYYLLFQFDCVLSLKYIINVSSSIENFASFIESKINFKTN